MASINLDFECVIEFFLSSRKRVNWTLNALAWHRKNGIQEEPITMASQAGKSASRRIWWAVDCFHVQVITVSLGCLKLIYEWIKITIWKEPWKQVGFMWVILVKLFHKDRNGTVIIYAMKITATMFKTFHTRNHFCQLQLGLQLCLPKCSYWYQESLYLFVYLDEKQNIW